MARHSANPLFLFQINANMWPIKTATLLLLETFLVISVSSVLLYAMKTVSKHNKTIVLVDVGLFFVSIDGNDDNDNYTK